MKLVLIEWIDSHSGSGWQPMHEIKKASEPVHCRSVGWLASEDGECKVVVPHVSGEKNGDLVLYGRGEITIPNGAIVKVRVLAKS